MKDLFLDIINDEQVSEIGLSEIVGGESAPTCPGAKCNVYTECPENCPDKVSCPGLSLVCRDKGTGCLTNWGL